MSAKYPFAVVAWLDHCGGRGEWTSVADLQSHFPVTIFSAGWIVKETKEFITLVPHAGIGKDGHITESSQGELCIIKKCIIQRHRVSKFDK